MANKWDKPQQDAIDFGKGNFLVSAGAGSGKTAVLTERIKELVSTKKASIDQLLVLTFTNKAAAEMKSRTRTKLPHLSSEVECADITTFDAFFLKLVKKYAFTLGIDPNVTIAEKTFLDIKEREFIEEALNKRYEKMDPAFKEMVEAYTLRDDDILTEYVLHILRLSELSPRQEDFFKEMKEKIYESSFLKEKEKEYYERCNAKLRAAHYLLLGSGDKFVQKDRDYLSTWKDLGDYQKLYDRLALECQLKETKGSATIDGIECGSGFPSAGGHKFDEIDKFDRGIARCLAKEVKDSLFLNGDPKEQEKKILETKKYAEILVDIAQEVDEEMRQFKKEKNAYSFSDIAALARKLLDDEAILSEIKNKYKFIMVDEYQDSSDLQEYFISKIANDNVFMVGDIKQSIYRFRNANPDIFAGKLADYSANKGGKAIFLQKNFRSRLEVIECVNSLFDKIMSEELGEVDYKKGQALVFGNTVLYGSDNKPEFKATMLTYDLDQDLLKAELEARAVANDIIEKVKNHSVVDTTKGHKECSWGDFAILMPTKSQFNTYKKVFGEAKIPLVATVGNELNDDDINMVFMRLLKLPLVIDDETAAKHCYASIKRSYLFEEDDDQLFDELQSGSYKDDAFMKEMREMKDKLLGMDLYKAVSFLIEKYGFVNKLQRIGNVKANFKTIASFLQDALNAEMMGLDYKAYVEHFENLSKYELKKEIQADFAGDNAVKLMTIHASKGLEFPIVYCPNLVRKFNNDDARSCYPVSKKYGILLPKNRTDDYSGNFLYSLFKEDETSKGASEYMRLFYVELTRASNQIIFVSPANSGESFEAVQVDASGKKVLTRTKKDANGKIEYSVVVPKTFNQFLITAGKAYLAGILDYKAAKTDKPVPFAKMIEMEHFDTPVLKKIDLPAEEVEEKKASKTSFTPINEAAAQYGSHMHRLLEFVSFKNKDASFINNATERAKIEKLFGHSIFDDLSDYKEFHEYGFIDDVNNLRGSIDLLLVEKGKKAMIIDYKTKSLDDEAYAKQLGLYKQYVERVFGLKAETHLLSISENVLKVVE